MESKEYYKDNDGMLWRPCPENSDDVIWRYEGNPVFDVSKLKNVWRICNSAVIMKDGKYIGIFRADNKCGKPVLLLGRSENGLDWNMEEEPVVFYEEDGSVFENKYCYDPRLIKIENIYYVVFCADVEGPSVYIAKTTDFRRFEKLPTGFLPYNRNGVLFPEKINGRYVMLSRPSDDGHTRFGNIYMSESPDMIYWGRHKLLMKNFYKESYWEGTKIGAGPAPIWTEEGWLLIYHGVTGNCNGLVYSMGVALLDSDDPSVVKYRSRRFLMTPEKPYETVGFTPNVVFPCTALADTKGRITIYYGAADTTLAVAFTTADKLLKFVKEYN